MKLGQRGKRSSFSVGGNGGRRREANEDIDPAPGNAEVYSGHHYLEIVSYLREEEYIPVKERMKLIES